MRGWFPHVVALTLTSCDTTMQRLPIALDLAYFVAQRKSEISSVMEAKASDSRVMSVAIRVRFEALRAECDNHVVQAKELQASFWSELSVRAPSLHRLDSIGARLQRCIRDAQSSFERLLVLNPTSSTTLSRYAEFMADVRIVSCRAVSCRVFRLHPPLIVHAAVGGAGCQRRSQCHEAAAAGHRRRGRAGKGAGRRWRRRPGVSPEQRPRRVTRRCASARSLQTLQWVAALVVTRLPRPVCC